MNRTLTVENLPDAVFDKLERSAQANGRSVDSEALDWLKKVAGPNPEQKAEVLARIRARRATLGIVMTSEQIDQFKREGRD